MSEKLKALLELGVCGLLGGACGYGLVYLLLEVLL